MQGTFEFFHELPARPKRPERLFFCLFPDRVTSTHIGRFRDQFGDENRLGEKRLDIGRLHVSLHHVGDYPRLRTKVVYAARMAGAVVSARRFEMTFHAIKSFEGIRSEMPLVLLGGSVGFSELHRMLGAALNKNGLKSAEQITPHMTVSYGRKPVPYQPIDPIALEVREFALVHSKLWLGEYEVIERWPLLREPIAPSDQSVQKAFSTVDVPTRSVKLGPEKS